MPSIRAMVQTIVVIVSVIVGVIGELRGQAAENDREQLSSAYTALIAQLNPNDQPVRQITFGEIKLICNEISENIDVVCALDNKCIEWD